MREATKRLIAHHHILNGPPVWTFRITTCGIDSVTIEPTKEYDDRYHADAVAHGVAAVFRLDLVDNAKEES